MWRIGVLVVLAGCGSKSPLLVEGAERDAGVDAPVRDVGRPDVEEDVGSVTAPLCAESGADVVVVYEDGRPSVERVDLSARVRIP